MSWQVCSPVDLAGLLAQMKALRKAVRDTQRQHLLEWKPHLHSRRFAPSASNMAAYIGLRRQDVRILQSQLATFGLSSLGRCEGHVVGTLDAVIEAIKRMLGKSNVQAPRINGIARAMDREMQLLRRQTDRLLGAPPPDRWTRLMITLPSSAATNYIFVRELLLKGMNCARINLAHDGVAAWEGMVENIRRAERDTGLPCKILMDLAGQKLRTGKIMPGPAVLHLKPKRDTQGRLAEVAHVILDASGEPGHPSQRDDAGRSHPAHLSVEPGWLKKIKPGDAIHFSDLRGHLRAFTAQALLSDTEVLASCNHGAYIAPNTPLEIWPNGKHKTDKQSLRTHTLAYTAPPLEIRVFQGDLLLLSGKNVPGEPAQRDKTGRIVAPAKIACAQPDVLDQLSPGQRVWIDDGRIGTVVEAQHADGVLLRVVRARPAGEKLNPEKGLNFPDTKLQLPALTDIDQANLDFVVKHADIVGYSFVNNASDVDLLVESLARLGGEKLGIIAKIETREAVRNLPEIIIHGAGRHPFGIMIARGDLAVEIGYEHLGATQEEILWLCEAAHVPVIWATQVLENMVKQGVPSRAEITDAAMAERAECVMLNKGPYVLEAMHVLDSVVRRMQTHQLKKTPQLRTLHW